MAIQAYYVTGGNGCFLQIQRNDLSFVEVYDSVTGDYDEHHGNMDAAKGEVFDDNAVGRPGIEWSNGPLDGRSTHAEMLEYVGVEPLATGCCALDSGSVPLDASDEQECDKLLEGMDELASLMGEVLPDMPPVEERDAWVVVRDKTLTHLLTAAKRRGYAVCEDEWRWSVYSG